MSPEQVIAHYRITTTDGKRFLISENPQNDQRLEAEITLVLNWAAEIK